MKRPAIASIGAALLLLLIIVILRTATLTSRQIAVAPAPPLRLDGALMAQRLSRAVQFRTISRQDVTQLPDSEFDGLRNFLAASFPLVHANLDKDIVGGHSLLFTWHGRESALKPILLMAHLDVVPIDPATESEWRYPPFSGALAEGFVWGRGTLDDKAGALAILEAVEHLVRASFTPNRTIHLAFGHDEEIGGNAGAARIAELLRARKVELEFVIDEGMNILDGVLDGIAAPVALIGIAEKGYLSLRLTAETAGGHSSIPPKATAIGLVSRALQKIDAAPFRSHLAGATREMLDFLGPEMAWSERLVFANLWLFDPLVRSRMASSSLTNAVIRTTVAPTVFNAGTKENVLPGQAAATINLRLMPGDTIAGAIEYVRDVIDDPRVEVTPMAVQTEPSPVTDTTGASFQLIHRTIREVAPEVLVAPSLLVAATDSRHYRALSANIFRFLPVLLGPDDTKRYHGVNERISLADYQRLVRFYIRLIENSKEL